MLVCSSGGIDLPGHRRKLNAIDTIRAGSGSAVGRSPGDWDRRQDSARRMSAAGRRSGPKARRRRGPGTPSLLPGCCRCLSGGGARLSPPDRSDQDNTISLAEASRIAGVSSSTLKRWAEEELVPVEDGRWTPAAAAQARVVARMRERGHSARRAAGGGPRAAGSRSAMRRTSSRSRRASYTRRARRPSGPGLEAELIERMMSLLGTPMAPRARSTSRTSRRCAHCADVLAVRVPPRRVSAARPGLRPVHPQDRGGRGPALPPLRPRAADPGRGPALGDGRGDGGISPRTCSRSPPRSWSTSTTATCASTSSRTSSGTWRPTSEVRVAARPGPDGLLLRRSDRASPGTPRRRGTRRPSTWSSASSRRSRRPCPRRRRS